MSVNKNSGNQVVEIGGQFRFVGLSSDTKPTTQPDGVTPLTAMQAVFAEQDTGDLYYWNGVSWSFQMKWSDVPVLQLLLSSLAGQIGLLAGEMQALRRDVCAISSDGPRVYMDAATRNQ